jgi:hypothetical protein
MLLRQKYLGMAEQLRLIIRRESREDGEIAFEDRAPCEGYRLSAQARAPAGLEEIEDHN